VVALWGVARSELVELRLTVELLEIKIALLNTGRSPGPGNAIAWGSAFSLRWHRRFHLARVCRVWKISRATLYRHLRSRPEKRSRSPWTDAEIVRRLETLIESSPFPAERYRKLWHRLRLQGVLVSKERVRKLINENKLLPAYGTILAARPDELWGIDAARVTTTDGTKAFVIFAIDHCTGECLAIKTVSEETVTAWVSLIQKATHYAFGSLDIGVARGLRIRCDNLPLFRGKPFCQHLENFGIRTSYIAPQNPRGNGLAERFVRTLRENRLSLRYFATLEELAREMHEFRESYNEQYILQRWKYRTPHQVRALFRQM
jgi:putative transposase